MVPMWNPHVCVLPPIALQKLTTWWHFGGSAWNEERLLAILNAHPRRERNLNEQERLTLFRSSIAQNPNWLQIMVTDRRSEFDNAIRVKAGKGKERNELQLVSHVGFKTHISKALPDDPAGLTAVYPKSP